MEDNKRPCTPSESLEQSLIEMRLMREGKMPKKSWWDYKREQELEDKTYNKIFLNEVKSYLKSKYSASTSDINLMLIKLRELIKSDPFYVFHYDSEYWADFMMNRREI